MPLGFFDDHIRLLSLRPGGACCMGPAGAGVASIGTRLGAPQSKAL